MAATGNETLQQAEAASESLAKLGAQTTKIIVDQPWIGYAVLGLAALVLALIAAVIIHALYKGTATDQIAGFLFDSGTEDPQRKPSVSRLQMLIWNFTVAFAFLYVLGTRQDILAAIKAIFQPEVLVLLGISNGTYLLGRKAGKTAANQQAGDSANATGRGDQPLGAGEVSLGLPGPQGKQ